MRYRGINIKGTKIVIMRQHVMGVLIQPAEELQSSVQTSPSSQFVTLYIHPETGQQESMVQALSMNATSGARSNVRIRGVHKQDYKYLGCKRWTGSKTHTARGGVASIGSTKIFIITCLSQILQGGKRESMMQSKPETGVLLLCRRFAVSWVHSKKQERLCNQRKGGRNLSCKCRHCRSSFGCRSIQKQGNKNQRYISLSLQLMLALTHDPK